jgi:acetyl esterase
MTDVPRMDPEIAAFLSTVATEASKFPPIRLELPFEPHRQTLEMIALPAAMGGPSMAETVDSWVTALGRRILCRIYRPTINNMLSVLVYFHGGGWISSSVDTHDRLAREYASGGGIAVVSVDYSLSPESKFPRALDECVAVVRHVAERGADWGIDRDKIIIGGDSVGGNLALATALVLRDAGGPPLRGILANYPVCDSGFGTPSYQMFGDGGGGLTREQMTFAWNCYVQHDADRSHPLAAPLRADLTGLPPVLVILAELDVLRSEGELLVNKLRSGGVPVETMTFDGMVHGFLRASETVRMARDALTVSNEWLKLQLA